MEKASSLGVMPGCGSSYYCPEELVACEDMAVFLEKSYRGASFAPAPLPTGTPIFADVPPGDGGCSFIHYLFLHNVTAGCGVGPGGQLLYCPGDHVSRAQMATFLCACIN